VVVVFAGVNACLTRVAGVTWEQANEVNVGSIRRFVDRANVMPQSDFRDDSSRFQWAVDIVFGSGVCVNELLRGQRLEFNYG
jgi:hypothetical protein